MNRQGPGQVKMMKTPEQLEYEDLSKKMRIATAKLRVAREGVDIRNLSQQNMDKIMRIFDDMEHIQRDVQEKTSKIQQEANIQTQKVNQDANQKFVDIQKKYQGMIKSLKESNIQDQTHEEPVVQYDSVVEEVREKTHEEKVGEITDIVLRAMRDSVYNRVDEIMRSADTKAEVTIGRGVDATREEIEGLIDHTKQTTVESAIVGSDNKSDDKPDDKPDDKDIPVITPEMMKDTDEEIAKRRFDLR